MKRLVLPLLALAGFAVVALGVFASPAVTSGLTDAPAAALTAPSAAAVASPDSGDLTPVSFDVPSIGASGSLIGLGLDAAGGWAVPDDHHPEQASWFTGAKRPGERGPAVILGHVNGYGQNGVFAHLDRIEPGALVTVTAKSGTVTTFKIDRVETPTKDKFPTTAVLGATTTAQIRLITCGGQLDKVHHRYLGSVIAYGSMVSQT